MPGVAFVIPTRNRPRELARTLGAIGALCLDRVPGGAEVVIADNGSDPPARAPSMLANGAPARVIRLGANEGAAARNIAAEATDADWLVMLDDDSHPTDNGLFDAIADAPEDVAAIGAEIFLLNGRREAGGLPEVFVGCGVAIRRGAFRRAGGYDPSFGFYAEEYDLSAKLILDGCRVIHDRRFRVLHEKSLTQRSMDTICRRLVRNNAWVAARYAPPGSRRPAIRRDVLRYARIAVREDAMAGYGRGFAEMLATLGRQPRRTMRLDLWERFIGVSAVRNTLSACVTLRDDPVVCVVSRGKNDWVVAQVIRELGLRTTPNPGRADAVIVGTCSPGPMLDAARAWRAGGATVVEPWSFSEPGPALSGRRALTLAS
ncbi:MAG: glycosyltransferase [Phycisphaeraceae bacterium]|nr:glycosyltransferase [Phycisphaeraceae bacterium]